MASHPVDHLNDSRELEVILVTTLSLCSFSTCSCIFFFFFIIIVLGKSRFFLLELREIDYELKVAK